MSFQQLALQFRSQDSYNPADYCVTPTLQMLWNQVHTPTLLTYIQGPQASGKTHLCHTFCHLYNGQLWNGDILTSPELLDMTKPIAIDNVEQISNPEVLFHTLNKAKEHQTPLFLTSVERISEFRHTLPDLISRLKTAQYLEIPAPDDMLLRGILLKRFADYQIRFTSVEVLDYLIPRIPRTYAFLDTFLGALMDHVNTHPRQVTLPLIRDVLGKLF